MFVSTCCHPLPFFSFSRSWKKLEKSFHQFIPAVNCFSMQSWSRFKEHFAIDSKETKYLQKLLHTKSIEWQNHKEKIIKILLRANPYSREGHLLKHVLKKCDHQNLKEIVHLAFDKIFDSSKCHFEKILPFLNDKNLEEAFGIQSIEKEVEEMALCLPNHHYSGKRGVKTEIQTTLKVVVRFFTNFMDTVLKAFNLIDAGKGPETIWDFSAMMNIYFKIFLLPQSVFVIVGAVVSIPWQMFLISTAIVLAGVTCVGLYLKYRPLPNKIPRACNLTEEAIMGKLDPVIGREKEIQEIGSYLGKKKDGIKTNLILVGEPGVGKTELVKGLAQQFQDKTIFSLSAVELAEGYTSIADKMRLILMEIKGHENEVVFFLDEFGDALKKNSTANLGGYLKPLISSGGIQVIAAATNKEYKEQIVTDVALQDRFTKIDVKPLSEKNIITILQHRLEHRGKGVRFSPKIAEEIFNKTKTLAQPRNSVKLLDLAINRVRALDIGKYVSEDLLEARNRLAKKQQAYLYTLVNPLENKSDIAEEIKAIKNEIKVLQSKTDKTRSLAKRVKNLICKQHDLIEKRNNLAKKKSNGPILPFLHWVLLPWMEAKVKKKLEEVKEIPMEISADLVAEIQKEWETGSNRKR